MKIQKRIIKKLVILAAIFLLLTCITGFLLAYLPSQMSEQHTNDIGDLYFQDTGYSVESFNSVWQDKIESFDMTAEDGHIIPVYYISANGDYENQTIILVHWHESNHEAMYPIAEVFLNKGWNVVLYDQRAHGKNTAKTVTFGYLESKDLLQVVEFVHGKANGKIIGALGQSMGAATIAYYSGTEHASENLDFAVIDSAFSGMYDEIYWEISQTRILPARALTVLGSGCCKLLYGYSFSDINIVNQMKSNSIPTLVIHSKADKKCPFSMGEALYDVIPHSNKMFVVFEEPAHLFSFWDEKEQYTYELFSFIGEFVK